MTAKDISKLTIKVCEKCGSKLRPHGECCNLMAEVREEQQLYPHMLRAAKDWLYLANHQLGATDAEKLAGFALSPAANNVRALAKE